MNKSERFRELDSLRALAAIGVIGWHYNHFGAAPLSNLMAPFYRHGLLLVDFFFVLSGFVLAHAYWRDGRRTRFVRNVQERIARLYPLHLVLLFAVALLQWMLVHKLNSKPFVYQFNDTYDFVLHLALLNSTGLERGFGFNAVAWSISTEFIVNVAFFLMIALPRGLARTGILVMFMIGLIMLVAQDNGGCAAFGPICLVNNGIFQTMVGFTVGIATYGLYTRSFRSAPMPKLEADIAGLLAIVATLVYFSGRQYTIYSDIAATIFLFPMIIFATIQSSVLKKILNVAPLVYLGEISYSIYMVHFPLQLAVHAMDVGLKLHIPYDRPRYLILFVVATIAAASLTYFTVEQPGKRWINSIGRRYVSRASGSQRSHGEA